MALGELGNEVFRPAQGAVTLWWALLDAGAMPSVGAMPSLTSPSQPATNW
jgi:hypothetical protein